MFTTTSAFKSLSESTNPFKIGLTFTFNGSDQTTRLLNTANVARTAGKFTAGRFNVRLANTDISSPISPGYNVLQSDKTQFFKAGVYGINFASSVDSVTETLPLFTGKLTGANFKNQKVTLSFLDKFEDLKLIQLGTSTTPLQFIDQDYNPADLFWSIVTVQGGLSALASTNNPDIDYTSWLLWKSNADILTQQVQAEFKGVSLVTALQKLEDITNSVIVGEGDGKIYTSIAIPTAIDSALTLTDSAIFDIDLSIDTNKIVNQGTVFYGYDTVTDAFADSIIAIDNASDTAFGKKEKLFQDTNIWHATKQSAQLFLDSKIAIFKDPVSIFRIDLGYQGVSLQLNDPIFLKTEPLSLDGSDLFSITGLSFNAGKGDMTITAENRLDNRGFFLDVTTLGLLDQSFNPLF